MFTVEQSVHGTLTKYISLGILFRMAVIFTEGQDKGAIAFSAIRDPRQVVWKARKAYDRDGSKRTEICEEAVSMKRRYVLLWL